MIPDDKLATRVGAAALAVLLGAIVFFVFVYGRIEWGAHIRVRVYLHVTGGLHEGAPVIVAGRTIGRVEAIALSPRGAPGTPLAGDEGVIVTLALDARTAARVDRGGDVFIASKGALADRYLELGPAPEPGTPYRDGDQVLGRDPPTLDRVLQRTWDNLTATGKFADELRPELVALRARLDELLGHAAGIEPPGPLRDELVAALSEARTTYDVGLGGDAGIARAREVMAHVRATIAEARAMLDQLDARVRALRVAVAALQGKVDARLPPLLDSIDLAVARGKDALAKIDPMLAVVADIADRVARGEGTVGKLANDPEFPEDAKDLGKMLKRQPWKLIGHPDDTK